MKVFCRSEVGVNLICVQIIQIHVQMILFDCDLYFQRAKERKTYLDEDLDDDEIDGKRNYSVDEKLASTKYNKSFVVTDLKGEGRVSRLFELLLEKTC